MKSKNQLVLPDFEFTELHIAHLLKHIRGQKSQTQMNRKLGFKTNQFARWESGHASISWSEFVKVCAAFHNPLESSIKYFFKGLDDTINASSILIALLARNDLKSFSLKCGVHYAKIRRWLLGETEPSLCEMLQVFYQVNSSLLVELLKRLDFLRLYPELEALYHRLHDWKKEYYREPKMQLVLHAFTLAAYLKLKTHKRGFISEIIGLTYQEEDSMIRKLIEIGMLSIDPNNQKYIPLQVNFNGYNNNPGSVALREYWCLQGNKKMKKKLEGITEDVFGSVVLRLSKKQKQELTSRLVDLVREFEFPSSEDTTEVLQILNVQLFDPK